MQVRLNPLTELQIVKGNGLRQPACCPAASGQHIYQQWMFILLKAAEFELHKLCTTLLRVGLFVVLKDPSRPERTNPLTPPQNQVLAHFHPSPHGPGSRVEQSTKWISLSSA